MKKLLIIVLTAVLLVVMAAGGILLYKTSTPEYALARTIMDVKESGMVGLKPHLTEDAVEIIENIEKKTDDTGISSVFSAAIQDKAISFVKENLEKVDWSVEDVLTGKKQADVIIGFNYHDNITGTVTITMIKNGREWKIDGIELPSFDKLSLW